MEELAGRSYIPKRYRISKSRTPVVDLLLKGIEDGGGRVVSSSFPAKRLAPILVGAEDGDNHRYGLLVYPFTTTRRATRNRPATEHRFQIRYGDPERVRHEPNPVGHDPAGVDITLVLAVDPETGIIVGLDPLVYAQLPMGISGYYRDTNAEAVRVTGWAWWAREKTRPRTAQGEAWDGLESMVGFRPDRLLDYARFEALATSLGFDTGLRAVQTQRAANQAGLATSLGFDTGLRLSLAEHFVDGTIGRHDLETLYGVSAATILDIIESNFRLGVAVRGSVAEHHLGNLLDGDPCIAGYETIDEDGMPDFRIWLGDGRELTIECKNALSETYKDGDAKVETQKTRDSGAGRKYAYDAFDIVAACMFSVTKRWTFKFKWARDLTPWTTDNTRIGAIQRIDDTWVDSLDDLLKREAPPHERHPGDS